MRGLNEIAGAKREDDDCFLFQVYLKLGYGREVMRKGLRRVIRLGMN